MRLVFKSNSIKDVLDFEKMFGKLDHIYRISDMAIKGVVDLLDDIEAEYSENYDELFNYKYLCFKK